MKQRDEEDMQMHEASIFKGHVTLLCITNSIIPLVSNINPTINA